MAINASVEEDIEEDLIRDEVGILIEGVEELEGSVEVS